MDALLTAATVGTDSAAEAISILVGALTLACGRSAHPAACISVAIESLEKARATCVAHMNTGVMQ